VEKAAEMVAKLLVPIDDAVNSQKMEGGRERGREGGREGARGRGRGRKKEQYHQAYIHLTPPSLPPSLPPSFSPKTQQLRQLALINGTLREEEYCNLCGA